MMLGHGSYCTSPRRMRTSPPSRREPVPVSRYRESERTAVPHENHDGWEGLILAPGCSVSPEAPEQNLRAVSSIG